MDIVLRSNVISLTECEEYCLKNKHICNAFSFGYDIIISYRRYSLNVKE